MTTTNKLFYGDNLRILRTLDSESVDLVYLDPPFNRGANYIEFNDTWIWTQHTLDAYTTIVNQNNHVADVLQAFKQILGETSMLAYIVMITPRLVELKRVLKVTGSIYVHCDSKANAFLRLLMDAIFGPKNFRNEIIWYYYNKLHDSRKHLFAKATDTILFYVKDIKSRFIFKQLEEKRDKPVKHLVKKKVNGILTNTRDSNGNVMYQIRYVRIIDNVWRIPCIQPANKSQRTGYPTQKPEEILRRIIAASSTEGDTVLDPFGGSGTTCVVANKMNRHWISIDKSKIAIDLTIRRLVKSCRLTANCDYKFVTVTPKICLRPVTV